MSNSSRFRRRVMEHSMLAEFRSFLKTANILPLAVGVIIGAAAGNVVSALADTMVMPFVGLLLPSGSWREARVVLHMPSGSETSLLYGRLLGATIDFVIIAFVVFLITRRVIKPLLSSSEEKTRKCPECLESILEAARRCCACTSHIPPRRRSTWPVFASYR